MVHTDQGYSRNHLAVSIRAQNVGISTHRDRGRIAAGSGPGLGFDLLRCLSAGRGGSANLIQAGCDFFGAHDFTGSKARTFTTGHRADADRPPSVDPFIPVR